MRASGHLQDECPALVDQQLGAGGYPHGGVHPVDQGRPDQPAARTEVWPVVDAD
jgi:hypothetical protein